MEVWFGSQGGTAESFARLLSEEAQQRGLETRCGSLREVGASFLETWSEQSKVVRVLVVATQGDGGPTEDSVDFHAWLKGINGPVAGLGGSMFAVFGLGDSAYPMYNAMGKLVEHKLELAGMVKAHKAGASNANPKAGCLAPAEEFVEWMGALLETATLRKLAGGAKGGRERSSRFVASHLASKANRKGAKHKVGMRALLSRKKKVSALQKHKRKLGFTKTAPDVRPKFNIPLGQTASTPPPPSSSGSLPPHPPPQTPPLPLPPRQGRMRLMTEPDGGDRDSYDGLVAVMSVPYFTSSRLAVTQRREMGGNVVLDLSLRGVGIAYRSGDHAIVCVENQAAHVEEAAAILKLDLSAKFDLSKAPTYKGPLEIPTPCSVQTLLSRFCDLSGPPTSLTLDKIGALCHKDSESFHSAAAIFSDKTSARSRASSVDSRGRVPSVADVTGVATILDVLRAVAGSIRGNVTVGQVVDALPRLRARPYSIASSSKLEPSTLQLCVTRVTDVATDSAGDTVHGVGSNYIATRESVPATAVDKSDEALMYLKTRKVANSKKFDAAVSKLRIIPDAHEQAVWVMVRRSLFTLACERANSMSTIIMVATGSGIAPMRPVLLEHAGKAGKTVQLYFGCRDSEKDFLYEEEIKLAEKDKGLVLRPAFSKAGPGKAYVQDRIDEHSDEFRELLQRPDTLLLVCGSSNMCKAVQTRVDELLTLQVTQSLRDDGRYVQEMF